jgi:hypothetical protein
VLLSWGALEEQATKQAVSDCLHSKADLVEAEDRGERKKGRAEKDNESSQYGDKIRSFPG